MDSGQGVGLGFWEAHFGAAQLGDRRRTKRLIDTANRILEHPQGYASGQTAFAGGLERAVSFGRWPNGDS